VGTGEKSVGGRGLVSEFVVQTWRARYEAWRAIYFDDLFIETVREEVLLIIIKFETINSFN
jgi:hypothetical protein